jgi:hypothetical protein
MIREATGLSLEACGQTVRDMPKVVDGKREKVHIHHVRRAISKANEVPNIQVSGVKRISTVHRIQLGGR